MDKIITIQDLKDCNTLFNQSVRLWERANNSGNAEKYDKLIEKSLQCSNAAEKILSQYSIKCDYPGLYPCFSYNGYDFYDLESVQSYMILRHNDGIV